MDDEKLDNEERKNHNPRGIGVIKYLGLPALMAIGIRKPVYPELMLQVDICPMTHNIMRYHKPNRTPKPAI